MTPAEKAVYFAGARSIIAMVRARSAALAETAKLCPTRIGFSVAALDGIADEGDGWCERILHPAETGTRRSEVTP